MKNKLVSVTSNPSTLVYFMSSMIQFYSWLKLLAAARLKLGSKILSCFLVTTIYNIKRERGREREREGERGRERERES